MKTRMIKSAGVILLALLMATAMNAQPNRHGGRSMTHGEGKGRTAYLDLTEAQSEEITKLRTDHYTTMKPLRASMVEIKAKERALLAQESVDLKAVDEVIDQQTELMNKMRKLQTKHQVTMKNVLSDEQVMKLDTRKRHSARMSQGRKGRGDGPRTGYRRGNDGGSGRGYGRSGRSI
jgi:Spy/CpxP family protein refolding chaperone